MSSEFERALNFVTDLREELAAAETRVAELEHSLADAMAQIEAIQGSNATHMARIDELEATNLALREDHAMLLAGADADAFVIGNLNAHALQLQGIIDSGGHVPIETPISPRAHEGTRTSDFCHVLGRLRSSCTD